MDDAPERIPQKDVQSLVDVSDGSLIKGAVAPTTSTPPSLMNTSGRGMCC